MPQRRIENNRQSAIFRERSRARIYNTHCNHVNLQKSIDGTQSYNRRESRCKENVISSMDMPHVEKNKYTSEDHTNRGKYNRSYSEGHIINSNEQKGISVNITINDLPCDRRKLSKKCVLFDVNSSTKASDDFNSVKASMIKRPSDLDTSFTGSMLQKITLKDQVVNNNLQGKNLIGIRTLGKLAVSKPTPIKVLDPTKPCKLKEIIDAELTSFNIKDPKVVPQSSEFWVFSRDARGCDLTNSDKCTKGCKLPMLPNKPKSGSQSKKHRKPVRRRNTILTCRSSEYETDNIHEEGNTDASSTISHQTKTLLERSKSLNRMMEYNKPIPSRKKSNLYRDLVVPQVVTRTRSHERIGENNKEPQEQFFYKRKKSFSWSSGNGSCSDEDEFDIKVINARSAVSFTDIPSISNEQKLSTNKLHPQSIDDQTVNSKNEETVKKSSIRRGKINPNLIRRSSSAEYLSGEPNVTREHRHFNKTSNMEQGRDAPSMLRRSSSAECLSDDVLNLFVENRSNKTSIRHRVKIAPNIKQKRHSAECFSDDRKGVPDKQPLTKTSSAQHADIISNDVRRSSSLGCLGDRKKSN